MSNQYIQRLRSVRGEYEAARQGFAFVNQNWHKYNIYQDVYDVTPANFHRAAEYVFATYLIRLSAEFEGILKYHITTNHQGIAVPKDAKVDWLISRVSKAENIGMILFTPVSCPYLPSRSKQHCPGLTLSWPICPIHSISSEETNVREPDYDHHL